LGGVRYKKQQKGEKAGDPKVIIPERDIARKREGGSEYEKRRP